MPRRYVLSKKDRRLIIESLVKKYPGFKIDKNNILEIYEDRDIGQLIIYNSKPVFIKINEQWIPHLRYLLENQSFLETLPVVIVDRGAVKPLLNGADLMIPGIRSVRKSFCINDSVVVVDEDYFKPIVSGLALVDSDLIISGSVKRGRAVLNIHRIGDKYWELSF